MTDTDARARIATDFPEAVVAAGGATITVTVPPGQWLAFAQFAKLEVIAWVEHADDRIAVLLKTKLGAGQTTCASIVPVYRGANWMERECFDMFGVVFEGHPDLRRMLLPDDWVGHPLLKSYAVDTPYPPYR